MEINDLVSVVIPVYNGEDFVRENAESVLSQSYKNLEIVYVCDGCTDQTVHILQRYSMFDVRLKIHVEECNHGAAISRNIGMNMVNGDWIIFLDSDDLFETNMIEVMLERAVEENADVSCCFWETFDNKPSKNKPIPNEYVRLYSETYPIIMVSKGEKSLLQPLFNASWNKMIHKSIYKKNVVFFQNLHNCDDAYFSSIVMMEAKKIVYIDQILVHHRSDKGRNTLTTSQRNQKNYAWEAYDKIYQYICQKDDNKELLQSFFNKICEYIQSYFMSSYYEGTTITISVYRNFFEELRTTYLERWGMKKENIQAYLSYFNWEVYKKICKGDYQLETAALVILAKENFVQNLAQKEQCSIWGCGVQGRELLERPNMKGIAIQHIFDSDPYKWGMYISGKAIEKFDVDEIENIIITSSKYYDEIRKQIGNKASHIYNLEKDIFTFLVG